MILRYDMLCRYRKYVCKVSRLCWSMKMTCAAMYVCRNVHRSDTIILVIYFLFYGTILENVS